MTSLIPEALREEPLPPRVSKILDDPPELCCSITQDIFVDPVFVEGFNFERAAIERWFASGKSTNPQTNATIPRSSRENLKTNFDKKSTVERWRKKVAQKSLTIEDDAFRVRCLERAKQLLEIDPTTIPPLILDSVLYASILTALHKCNPTLPSLLSLCTYMKSQTNWKGIQGLLESHPDLTKNSALLSFWIASKEALAEDQQEMPQYRIALSKLLFDDRRWDECEKVCRAIPMDDVSEEVLEMVHEVRENAGKSDGDRPYIEWIIRVLLHQRKYVAAKEAVLSRADDLRKPEKVALLQLVKKELLDAKQNAEASQVCVSLSELVDSADEKMVLLEESHQLDPLDFYVMQELFRVTKTAYAKIKTEVVALREENQRLRLGRPSARASASASARRPQPPTSSQPAKPSPVASSGGLVIHNGIVCDGCRQSPVFGKRYQALDNANYDLCEACYKKGIGRGRSFRVISVASQAPGQAPQPQPPSAGGVAAASVAAPPPASSRPRPVPAQGGSGGGGGGIAIHASVICDGCRRQPIVGKRYSAVGEDFDLCETCFGQGKAGARRMKVFERPVGSGRAVAAQGGQDFSAKIRSLRQAGIHLDESTLRQLLKKHNGDVSAVMREAIKLNAPARGRPARSRGGRRTRHIMRKRH